MPGKFKVELVTPQGAVLDKEVEEIVAPGIMGEFGVLVGHTQMLTFIKPGVFSFLENDRFHRFVVGPGFCEVLGDAVTVLVDDACAVDEIDAAAASSELSQLEQELGKMDAAADPAAYEKLVNKVKVARTKVSAARAS